MIRLIADGKATDYTSTVTEATGWTYKFEDMPKYKNSGKLIEYTVEESVMDGYTTTYDGLSIINTHVPETVDISGVKSWNDADDQDGKRPESITINLLANGIIVDTEVVTAEDGWRWTFNDMPKYEAGKAISYATVEAAIDDYSTKINGYDVTNAYTPKKTSVSVSKVWKDAENQDGIRPASVKVQVLADGNPIDTAVLSADNSWAYTWSELDMYDDGTPIEYTVKEVGVAYGYKASYTGDKDSGYVIVNTHKPETVVVDGTKTWADVDDQDGKRPKSITVLLLKNGVQIDSMTISEENDWKWAFTDLPKFEAGSEIDYAIEEVIIPDYETSIDQINGKITNRHDPELTFVQVAKSWQDNSDQDGIRPTSITVNLLADDKRIDSKTVTAADGWTTEFTNLPKYKDGKLIEYTITEDAVKGYKTDYIKYKDYLVIVNTHEPETVKVEGNKTWDDKNNQDGIRPDSILVKLYADGVKVDEKEVRGSNGWKYSFEKLPKFSKGKEIEYTIGEIPIDGYTTTYDGFNITNRHMPDTIDVKGKKIWNDNDDQDGKRPATITVHLRGNGQILDSKVVTAEDNWTYEWTELEKFSNGKEVKYTITETPVSGYTIDHDGYDLINTHTPGVVSVDVTKGWEDQNDLDGIRPDSIEIELFADGETTGKTITLKQSNGWHGAFTNLEEYDDSEKIIYTVKEVGVAEGYTSKVTGSAEDGFTILNTHDPETVKIEGSKTWDDNDDQDGKRPKSITVKLLANGEMIDTKTVTALNGWKYDFGELNKYHSGGKEIKYEIVEIPVDGYEAEVTDYDVNNSHKPAVKDISGSKTWKDNNDQDGIRPDNITVKLLADGEVVETATATENDGWSWIFEDVPVYKNGKAIEYTVEEEPIEGYEASVEGYDIINTHEPETKDISGSKTWDDADNQDGIRPESIIVHLLANGIRVATDIVDEDSDWSWLFEDLPVYEEGKAIKYTVEEEPIKGYKAIVNGYDITNKHIPETTEITGSKTWDDANDQDGKRPESIVINLLADGTIVKTVTVTAANAWEWQFKDLPVYKDGKAINYTIDEEDVIGYKKAIDGYNVTNTHIPETITVDGEKSWEDNNDQDGVRPESIVVNLLADGVEISEQKVTAEDGWKWSFANLPKYTDGEEVVYTVIEDQISNYTTEIDQSTHDITNIHDVSKTSVTVVKAWDDANDQDGIRPESVEITLYANGNDTGKTITLSEKNKWTGIFEALDEYADGEKIEYTVSEEKVTGYEVEYSGDDSKYITITNKHVPETIDVSGNKKWDDANDQDGIRPESIKVSLLADEAVVDTKVVTADDDWAWTFEDVDKFSGGKEITYTVKEETVKGYTAYYDGMNIKNSHEPMVTDFTGSKVWDDADNQDGIRPEAITVKLLADGELVDFVEVSAANNWTWEFSDVPVYADGNEIEYTVEEMEVPAGYEATVNGKIITNTHTPDKTDVTVTKNWNDANDQDGIRPAEVKVQLYADGETSGEAVTLNDANRWTYTWTELDKNKAGKTIEYTVAELDVPDAYESMITGSQATGYVIINSYEPESTELTVYKKWQDKHNKYDKRPDDITVCLYADGEAYQTVELSENTDWQYTFENLPVYENGKGIVYTVSEEPVEGYTAEIDGFTIINTINPEEIDNAADTGDDSHPWTYGFTAMMAIITAAGALFLRRRES